MPVIRLFRLECAGCEEWSDDYESLAVCQAAAKVAGWRQESRPPAVDWYCPDCAAKEEEEAR